MKLMGDKKGARLVSVGVFMSVGFVAVVIYILNRRREEYSAREVQNLEMQRIMELLINFKQAPHHSVKKFQVEGPLKTL